VNITVEQTGEGTVYRAQPRHLVTEHGVTERSVTERAVPVAPARDKVRWGPILAGLIATIASMLVLTVLGLAVGLSVFDPGDGDGAGTSAVIWSALSALIAFFIGGWVTGKTAAVHGDDNAILNGLMVGATALALVLWLAGMGLGNLLGGIGSNIGDIARIGVEGTAGIDTTAAAQDARNVAVSGYDEARNSAWGTLAGMVLALAAAAVGALVGHKNRHMHDASTDDGSYQA